MKEIIKAYTSFQADRLGQLVRCLDINRRLDEKREEMAQGAAIVIFIAGRTNGEVFDDTKRAVVRGFAVGAFNESMSDGLQDEVRDIMQT